MINSLTDLKRVLKTPGATVTGVYHHRHAEPRLTHFLGRFAKPRLVKFAGNSSFVVEEGGRLDVNHRAGWIFNGTDEVSLTANDNKTVLLTYKVSTPEV